MLLRLLNAKVISVILSFSTFATFKVNSREKKVNFSDAI